MIEDALKSTRTLHRLIMTVSLVTLVFASSLYLPSEKVTQREAIDALLNVDFLAYDQFVADQVEVFKQENLLPIGTSLNEEIDAGGYLVFNLHHLGEAFFEPLHVGKLLTDEVALAEISNTTLAALDALNGLDLASDVQVLVPRTDKLIPEIRTFLRENHEAGKRIDTIRVGIDDVPLVAESFLPGTETTAGLYFELVDAVRIGGVPVFSANFTADIATLPGTSFIQWLKDNSDMKDIISIQDNQVIFAPNLGSAPSGFREEKLGLLHQNLTEDIASSGPEKQSATILGTKVPGLLIVIASPLTLLVLSYYFTNHTGHLVHLVGTDNHAFKNFAWMPLAIRTQIPPLSLQKLTYGYRISGWILETIASAIILPVLSLGVLYWKLSQFGNVTVLSIFVISAASAGIGWLGILSVRNIGMVRLNRATS